MVDILSKDFAYHYLIRGCSVIIALYPHCDYELLVALVIRG